MTKITNYDILTFLRDKEERELRYTGECGASVCLNKIHFDENIDFIYEARNSTTEKPPFRINKPLEYCGFFSHKSDTLVGYIEELAPGYQISTIEFTQKFKDAQAKAIQRMIRDESIPITEKPMPLSPTYSKEISQSEVEYYAKTFFVSRMDFCEYKHGYYCFDSSTDTLIRFANESDEYVQETATDYVMTHANDINRFIEMRKRIMRKLNMLKSTSGEHWYTRDIAYAATMAPNAKWLTIEILKRGKHMIGKISASELSRTSTHYYSPYQMDDSSKETYFEMFGNDDPILPSEITKISHGRKVLYEKEERENCPMPTMESNIRQWHKAIYPSDPMWEDIDPDVTFQDAFDAIDKHEKDIYDVLGVCDSFIREHVFTALAAILDVDYKYIFDKWLHEE